MSLPIPLKRKFDRSMEKLLAHTGPEALKPTFLVLQEFRGLSNNPHSNTIDQYCANIFSVINLSKRRFDNWVIPVGRYWAKGLDYWTNRPGWLTLPPSRAWDSQHDAAFIQFAERILALVKLVQDLPFDGAARRSLTLLIRIKAEIFSTSSSTRPHFQFQSGHLESSLPNHPSTIGAWLKEAKRIPENWEASAFATVHRRIDEDIMSLLSIPEAITWDFGDDLARLVAARNEVKDCSKVNSKEAMCACHAIFQPLIDRGGAMLIENRVDGAVTGKLPAEMVEEVLRWSLIMEENSALRDSKAAGGFRVIAKICGR